MTILVPFMEANTILNTWNAVKTNVEYNDMIKIITISKWCNDNNMKEKFDYFEHDKCLVYYFKDERDAIHFALRWS